VSVTLGFIGLGAILPHHLAGLKETPEFELVSVCDVDPERVKRWSQELGCRGFTGYRDLLAEAPDAVLVALPHGLHCEAAVEALQAGCHVLVEKPMAVSADECRRMLKAARQHDRHLGVAEIAGFQPGPARTGERFRAGDLGRFFTGSILNERFYFHEGRPAWFLDPAMSGGGMFSNVGLHRLAVARACLPGLTPVSVSASVSHLPEYRVEACTSALVRYREGGAMLYEEVGYYPRPEWLNAGTHFMFEAGIVMWDDRTWRMMTRKGAPIEEPLSPARTGYGPVYAQMLSAIRGERGGPEAWEYALDTAIAQAAYASAREGREIDLTRPPWTIARDER
jgi:predicted dehydrogenase